MSPIPKLFVLHIGHVIIVCILKCFCDASAISLLVLSYADDTIDECEDDADGGRYDLQLGLAFSSRMSVEDSYRDNPASSVQRLLIF